MSVNSRKRTSTNVATLISSREQGPWKRLGGTPRELQKLAEDKAAISEMEEIHCKLPNSVRATFLMAFSPDGTKVASTHGDHKIYICNVKTGKLLHTLEGHPRTPWCLAFHPSSNDILASGCLGGEVRVWDLHGGSEVWVAEQNTVITSLAFHPMDKVLVIATFNQIHFWDWSRPFPFASCKTNSEKEKVRFVKFDPLGNRLITGISNLPPENFRNSVFDSILNQRASRPPPSRSILTRLMSMYRHLEGLEEFSWPHESSSHTMSPTQEEALHHAREYALVTTHVNRLRHNTEFEQVARDEDPILNHSQPSTSGLQHFESGGGEQSENILESQHGNTTRDFWATFQRLRSICSSLERTMQQHQQLQQSTESQVENTTERATDTTNASGVEEEQEEVRVPILEPSRCPDRDGRHSQTTGSVQQNASQSLMSLLTRLQNSLQNAALTTAFAQEQIQQVRLRISEILERLANVSGYRARLTSLRDQIYEAAERTAQRGEDNSPSQRWDLAHCLWLVEMSLQLTRQMQRILAADYRLTQLHLTTSTSQSLPQESNMPSSSMAHNFSSGNDGTLTTVEQSFSESCDVRPDSHSLTPDEVTPLPHSEEQHQVQNRFLNPSLGFLQDNQSSYISRLPNPFSHIEGVGRQARSWNENSPFIWRRQTLDSVDRVNSNSVLYTGREMQEEMLAEVPRSHLPWLHGNSNSDAVDISLHTSERHSEDLRNSDSLPPTNPLQRNVEVINTEISVAGRNRRWERPHSYLSSSNQELQIEFSEESHERLVASEREDASRTTSSPIISGQSRFRIPEVQIDASPSIQEEPTPLPHHQRPRSPPLATILSGSEASPPSWGRVPTYLSVLYDPGIRPRLGALLGIHETAHNLTHRIQCWDFTRFHIPSISDARKNVVVRKCKIHNDASVDISSDGELLAALVPTTAILAHAAMLAIYSLNPHSLGQCLYTWGFEPNAISVSFSPLGRYIVVGLASSRLYLSSIERETVAQILKLEVDGKCNIPVHVRSLTQQSAGQQSQVSLNSVCWLPQPGQGLIYGTNRGCLCICRPVAPLHNDKQEVPVNGPNTENDSVPLSLGFHRVVGSGTLNQMLSTATQTTQPQTQTTGTQTPASEDNRNGDGNRDENT